MFSALLALETTILLLLFWGELWSWNPTTK